MSEADEQRFGQLRQAMVKLIAAQAKFCSDEIRKDRLDERVMVAMESVPRHEFVPSRKR